MQLRSLVKLTLRRLGWNLVRIENGPRLEPFQDQRSLLHGGTARVIFDVGANLGQTAAHYRKLFPDASIHSFEPFENTFRRLSQSVAGDAKIHAHRLAVSDSSSTATFFVNQAHCTNSLLPSAESGKAHCPPGWTETVAKVQVPTITLDEFCEREHIDAIDILKSDVQGAEMLVLRGAQRLLQRHAIDIVFAEVLFADIYENQTDFCEVVPFMRSHGYVLYWMYDLFHKGDLPLAWADAIFISPKLAAALGTGMAPDQL
jgi:FkbM family methyltransferase